MNRTTGVPCSTDHCANVHPEGPLQDGWVVTITEDRLDLACPACDDYWVAQETGVRS